MFNIEPGQDFRDVLRRVDACSDARSVFVQMNAQDDARRRRIELRDKLIAALSTRAALAVMLVLSAAGSAIAKLL